MPLVITPDKAISDYLTFISDPESLKDDDLIDELQGQLNDEVDPLRQLSLRDQLERLRTLPEDAFLLPFLEHAKAYAEEHGISISGFESMGVDRKVLRDAGLKPPGSYTTAAHVIKRLREANLLTFTQPQIITLTGAAPGTVRKAINQLVAAGEVTRTDEFDPTHSGRGSRAKLFRVIDVGFPVGQVDQEEEEEITIEDEEDTQTVF